MRQPSVSELKRNCKLHVSDKPRDGTKLRRMYDLLMTGQPVLVHHVFENGLKSQWGSIKEQLVDFYGLEIVHICRGLYRCVGVWDGPYFVPIDHEEVN